MFNHPRLFNLPDPNYLAMSSAAASKVTSQLRRHLAAPAKEEMARARSTPWEPVVRATRRRAILARAIVDGALSEVVAQSPHSKTLSVNSWEAARKQEPLTEQAGIPCWVEDTIER